MSITIFGLLFIPLTLYMAFFAQKYLLPLAILASVFQAASVINVTGGSFEFGVPPYYFVACLIFLYTLAFAIRDRRVLPPRGHPCRPAIILLILFWALAVASAFIFPRIFAGLDVFDPRLGIDQQFNAQTALHWTASNLAQAAYLTLNVGVVFYALRASNALLLKKALAAAVLVVMGVSVLQILFAFFGVRLPMDVLSSNPVYAQGEQAIGSLVRINGTFTEPSLAGAFFAAVFVGLLASFLSGKRRGSLYAALAVIGLLLLSTTSSTGYFAAAITLCILFLYFSPLTRRGTLNLRRARAWIVISGGILCTLAAVLLFPALLQAVMAMTLQKGEGISFLHRIAADLNALQLVRQTFGIGVGLGSNRPSGLATYLLSNTGIAGIVLFFAFIQQILRPFPGPRENPFNFLVAWGFITFLIAQIIAVPDPNLPVLWASIALLIAAHHRTVRALDARKAEIVFA